MEYITLLLCQIRCVSIHQEEMGRNECRKAFKPEAEILIISHQELHVFAKLSCHAATDYNCLLPLTGDCFVISMSNENSF